MANAVTTCSSYITTIIAHYSFCLLIPAWQQHDVQELCRVMFDALESKFKKTDQVLSINIYVTSQA